MEREIILILDNLRSRENVGSLFRTADAAGVSKIYICGISPTPRSGNFDIETLSPKQFINTDKIAKTALGAEQWVPWDYHLKTGRLIQQLIRDGVHIVALEKTKQAQNIFKIKLPLRPIALVVGNEVAGLSKNILSRADTVAAIPMHGKKESLNVAVAAGIALYAIINS
jgi:tRNA G18 (ribose-2'-O)-methylase SpoU